MLDGFRLCFFLSENDSLIDYIIEATGETQSEQIANYNIQTSLKSYHKQLEENHLHEKTANTSGIVSKEMAAETALAFSMADAIAPYAKIGNDEVRKHCTLK